MAKKKTKSKKDDTVTQLEQSLEQANDNWKRALADYHNLEKRTQVEKEQFARFAARQVIEGLLPSFDTLEIAARHINDAGLNLAIESLHKALKQEGLERIEAIGKQFDPSEMECVEIVVGETDNEVVEELRAGYKLQERIIRPVQVKVAKREEKSEIRNSK